MCLNLDEMTACSLLSVYLMPSEVGGKYAIDANIFSCEVVAELSRKQNDNIWRKNLD